jgi:hypothetical protein
MEHRTKEKIIVTCCIFLLTNIVIESILIHSNKNHTNWNMLGPNIEYLVSSIFFLLSTIFYFDSKSYMLYLCKSTFILGIIVYWISIIHEIQVFASYKLRYKLLLAEPLYFPIFVHIHALFLLVAIIILWLLISAIYMIYNNYKIKQALYKLVEEHKRMNDTEIDNDIYIRS